jgi:hypothetical protein
MNDKDTDLPPMEWSYQEVEILTAEAYKQFVKLDAGPYSGWSGKPLVVDKDGVDSHQPKPVERPILEADGITAHGPAGTYSTNSQAVLDKDGVIYTKHLQSDGTDMPKLPGHHFTLGPFPTPAQLKPPYPIPSYNPVGLAQPEAPWELKTEKFLTNPQGKKITTEEQWQHHPSKCAICMGEGRNELVDSAVNDGNGKQAVCISCSGRGECPCPITEFRDYKDTKKIGEDNPRSNPFGRSNA